VDFILLILAILVLASIWPRTPDPREVEKKWLAQVEPLHRDAKGYPPDWEFRRIEVFLRSNGRCQVCGNRAGSLRRVVLAADLPEQRLFPSRELKYAHVHHRKAISEAGNHSLDNLQLLCARCHIRKHPESHVLRHTAFKSLSLGRHAKLRTARKYWNCSVCGGAIKPGDQYYGADWDRCCLKCTPRERRQE